MRPLTSDRARGSARGASRGEPRADRGDAMGRGNAVKWGHPRIARELKRLFRAGRDISSRTLRKTHTPLHAAAIHWFGSYRAAVEAAGIDYARVSRGSPNHWSREAIV